MRTDQTLEGLCDTLSHNGGDVHDAARMNGVSPAFVYKWIKDDKVAAEAIQEAQRIGYGALESEAIRRAMRGVEEDVWFKGERVGTKTTYSDGLLGKVMEARIPEYSKQKDGGNHISVLANQINIMPRANSYEEWLGMKDATLNRDALPAPDNTVDAEFEEVVERPLAALGGLL